MTGNRGMTEIIGGEWVELEGKPHDYNYLVNVLFASSLAVYC